MQIAARTGAWEKSEGGATPMTWADGFKYYGGSLDLHSDPIASATTTIIPVVPGHSITWSNCGNVPRSTMQIVDEYGRYKEYWGAGSGNRTIAIKADEYGLLIVVLTENKYLAKVVDDTDRITLFENGMILVPVASAANGGYNRQCVRRSHRRFSRPSARFCAHSHRWEVAA